MAQVPNAQVAPTGGMNGFPAANSAVPDSNTLLAYKLLQDSWKENTVFDDLLKEEMKYLVTGISLLQNDPYLQMKMGGVTLNNAGILANTLKSKVSELDIRQRIEPAADTLLTHEYAKPTLRELAPARRAAVKVHPNGDKADPRYSLDILAGKWQSTGIQIPDTSSASGADNLRAPRKFSDHNGGISSSYGIGGAWAGGV